MRLYTVSDLHVDYDENLQWVLALSRQDYVDDVLILPGDISDDMTLLARVFESLVRTFKAVLFVPGNHELWVDKDDFECSLEKFEAVLELCAASGVITEVYHANKLSIVPLFSWYDFSFGEPDKYLRRAWRDFRSCKWPSHLQDDAAITDYFLERNTSRLNTKNDTVISFSHFLPSIEVMPSRIPMHRRVVYPVLGSEKVGAQVVQLNPKLHIYGHSHVNQDKVIDGVRYVNNAYAYPSEERISRKQLHCISDVI